MERPIDDSPRVEIGILRQMGLRWAVLAAWRSDLHDRGVRVSEDPLKMLETARVKISSGCFSSCEVGCDLAHIERLLVSADASSSSAAVDFWLDLLAHSMAENLDTEKLLNVQAVKFHYSDCKLRPCQCGK